MYSVFDNDKRETCFENMDVGCLLKPFAFISKVGRSSILFNVQSKSLYMKLFHIVYGSKQSFWLLCIIQSSQNFTSQNNFKSRHVPKKWRLVELVAI